MHEDGVEAPPQAQRAHVALDVRALRVQGARGLERGLPTTPADILALRRIKRSRRLSTAEYLRALAQLPPRPPGPTRRVYGGEPFRLTD